ncbi:uncharacterized protein [Chelonus insularis]|uniref:uncharacterized protein n=1 Tax=Chelonus insularis TaxID=460826 RepID=UPI00158BC85E|nr:uncharacterized protein LOC118073906 [Chelonus insularis]XP_034950589.1 uncharacterized protein LOC118073906 [Chelonus insularis]
MWLSVSLFLLVSCVVVSKTEPVDLSRQSDVLFSPESANRQKSLQNIQELAMRLKQSANLKEPHKWNDMGFNFDPKDVDMAEINDEIFNDFDDLQVKELDDVDIKKFSNLLISLLNQPTWANPLVVVEDPLLDESDGDDDDEGLNELEIPFEKRSRYYRQYPGKRQNYRSRNSFDYESLHVCTPSREDVFQLLVALHDVRQGNKSRTVNFCKRRRPVGTVFTNIRFLGRKK